MRLMRVLGVVFQMIRFTLITAIALFLLLVVWSGVTFDESKQPWDSCRIPLPEHACRLTFWRRYAHSFLAEYQRSVTVVCPGDEPHLGILPNNPGGRTSIDVYWILPEDGNGALVLLRDHLGDEYLVDLCSGCVRVIIRVVVGARVFAGPVQGRQLPSTSVRTDWTGTITVEVDDQAADEITQLGIYENRQHLGRIVGQGGLPVFVPAAEAPKAGE